MLSGHDESAPPRTVAPKSSAASGAVLATVCSIGHLPFARCFTRSFRSHHPEIEIVVAISDARPGDSFPELEGTVLSGEELGGSRFPLLSLKYTPFELCAALKPYLLERLLAEDRFHTLLYLDSDTFVFSPLDCLLERLVDHDVVVSPHILGPTPPHWNRRRRPMLAHVAEGGVLNSGMFGLRNTAQARGFIATWRDLVSRHGAFVRHGAAPPEQTEQHAFNWVIGFTENVHVLRDSAYNVAYWNLHDRSLRWGGLDGPDDDSWTVDGRPLLTFHFSGYSPSRPHELTRHHAQHLAHADPSLEALLRFYQAQLQSVEDRELMDRPYRFGSFPSGIPIDDRIRNAFKKLELALPLDLDPWTEEGERALCTALLTPSKQIRSFLPPLMAEVRDERPDLQASFPDADLRPQDFIRWFSSRGAAENGYQELYECYRPTSPKLGTMAQFADLAERHPGLLQGLEQPLGTGRASALQRLEVAGMADLARSLATLDLFIYRLSPVHTARAVLEERPDVRHAFPDFLGRDAPAFSSWLATHGVREHGLPPEVSEIFLKKAQSRALCRLFAFLEHARALVARWPLGLVGVDWPELATAFLAALANDPEHDLDDIAMYMWTMEEKPWEGLPLTLELSHHSLRKPSPLLPEGQEDLLAPVLRTDQRFADALDRYRRRFDTPYHREEEAWVRHFERDASVYACWTDLQKKTRRPDPRAVNVFAPFKSTIGLGSMSHGLVRALAHTSLKVNRVTTGATGLRDEFAPNHVLRRHRYDYGVNVFVSYPHFHERLLEGRADHVVEEHSNVAYLAWEQRDGSPMWRDVYAGFDQIWTLSEFAARAFRRYTDREVRVIPCCLDFEALPAAASKGEVGLPADKVVFLNVFDPQSSFERKNPEAIIEAFCRAFRRDDPVRLVMKISNPQCHEYREKLRQLVDRGTESGLDIEFRFATYGTDELLRLMSAADCYVSLHRAEGFGLTCAEAMAYGRPVVATRYSGNLEFMDDDSAYLVDCREVAVEVPDGPYPRGSIWASPDIDHAAHCLRDVLDHPENARERGEAGRAAVTTRLSPEVVGRTVEDALAAATGAGRPSSESTVVPTVPVELAAG